MVVLVVSLVAVLVAGIVVGPVLGVVEGVVVLGTAVVTARLTGPDLTVYMLENILPTRVGELPSRVHRLGQALEGMVVMHRFTLHSTYIWMKEKKKKKHQYQLNSLKRM